MDLNSTIASKYYQSSIWQPNQEFIQLLESQKNNKEKMRKFHAHSLSQFKNEIEINRGYSYIHRSKKPNQGLEERVSTLEKKMDQVIGMLNRRPGSIYDKRSQRIYTNIEELEETDQRQMTLNKRLDTIEKDIPSIKQNIAQLKQSVVEVKQSVVEVKQSVAELKQSVDQLKKSVAQLVLRQNSQPSNREKDNKITSKDYGRLIRNFSKYMK